MENCHQNSSGNADWTINGVDFTAAEGIGIVEFSSITDLLLAPGEN